MVRRLVGDRVGAVIEVGVEVRGGDRQRDRPRRGGPVPADDLEGERLGVEAEAEVAAVGGAAGRRPAASQGSSAASRSIDPRQLDDLDPAGGAGGERVVEVGEEALVVGEVVEQGGAGLAVVDGDGGEVAGQGAVGLHGVGEQAVTGQQPGQVVPGAGGDFRRVGLLAQVVQVQLRLQARRSRSSSQRSASVNRASRPAAPSGPGIVPYRPTKRARAVASPDDWAARQS